MTGVVRVTRNGEPAWMRGRGEVFRDAHGVPHFVFPARRHGNVLLAPQPGRARRSRASIHNCVVSCAPVPKAMPA